MQTGYRFRCYPTPAQQAILLRWIGCQRFILQREGWVRIDITGHSSARRWPWRATSSD
ncbi:helix-turn-helix domain-containing protein [Cupriavidus basilensis]